MRSHRLVPLLAAATLSAVAALGLAPAAAQAADPPVVSVPGDFNQSLGCASDWAPDCAQIQLDFDAASGVYSKQFSLAAGDYQFKVAQDGSWDVNYGQDGVAGGANIDFTALDEPTVFVYDPVSHLVQAAPRSQLVTLPGSYQSEAGCPGDWQPDCLASTMYSLADGAYTYSTDRLPQGAWEAKVAVGLSWDVNYGRDGIAGGANYEFVTAAGELTTFTYTPADHKLAIDVTNPPLPGTGQFQAIWLDRDTIAWPPALVGDPATLDYALAGHSELVLTADGQVTADQASHNQLTQGYLALKVTAAGGGQPELATLEAALRGPLEIVASRAGTPVAQTGAQRGDVLDDLYGAAAQDEALGTTWSDGAPTLKLWAPTATAVSLELWTDPEGQPTVVAASRAADGVWTVAGQPSWKNAQYLWSVEVYAPSVDQVVTNHVTDPYATALTVDSTRGVLIDLDDPAWAPSLWTDTPIPAALRTQAEQTIYELHIRDFSAADSTVPQAERGTYKAFTRFQSDGMTHLAELADAGLTTVHLLPSFDIATIPETQAEQLVPNIPAQAAPDSPAQQAAVAQVSDQDAFNWGYDPWHWSAPEGSYATAEAQNGGARTAQFREMVGGLHSLGLRVVLDEVFNHTSSSGQDPKSVLDQIVPGYYQRLSATGAVETSTCCQNVATENVMAGKMMVDSVVTWVKYYHVDGFRFDIMGHHSLQNMIDVRAALDALTVERDGVDGQAVYLYGEAWNFGEVIDDALFVQARQANIAGTGIGTFNDRLRDGVRGGGPFDSDQRTYQGFGTGLYTDRNQWTDQTPEQQLQDLYYRTNMVRLGLMGNLADYPMSDSQGLGTTVLARDLDYGGQPAGYAQDPTEVINYVDAHDNETLYDNGIWKLPVSSTMDSRIRMNTLSLAATALGQAPSFWSAGTEILRSKSLDRNSYNAGDHFNAIDWSLGSNVFGTGLPMASDNQDKWSAMAPLLANPDLKPTADDMAQAYAQALDLLRLRQSTPLFTLGTGELVKERVHFLNAGVAPTPGLLVMLVEDAGPGAVAAPATATDIDPEVDALLVVFNASPDPITEALDGLAGRAFSLSPVQQDGADPVVKQTVWSTDTGAITIPGRSVAVLLQAPAAEPEPTPTPTPEPTPTPAPDASPATGPDSLADTGGRAGLDLLLAAGLCLGLGLVGLGSGLVTRGRPGPRVRL